MPVANASLRENRNFIAYLASRTVSQIGTSVSSLVIPLLFLELTGSATQTGVAFAAGFVPYILLSLPAGVWADQWGRKYLMIGADIGRLIALATVPLVHAVTGHTPIALLYGVRS